MAFHPKGVNITATFDSPEGISDENIAVLRNMIIEKSGVETELTGLRAGEIPGLFTEQGITIDYSAHINFSLATYDDVGYLSLVSLEDYNRMSGDSETLAEDECLLYCIRTEFDSDTFAMENGKPYRVKRVLDSFFADSELNTLIVPTICIVVRDFDPFVEPGLSLKNSLGDPMMMFDWRCGFDLDTPEEEIAAASAIREAFRNSDIDNQRGVYSYSVESREANRTDFFHTYGRLLFLGIMLSIVFLLAAVLIIYYKQISEGYEDQSRFDIMHKVGMTKRDIRRSINSQILTVFFLPLVFAGIHLAFAFPFLWKILMLFKLRNLPLMIVVTLICFMIFGLLYAVVYKITSNAYYAIVSGAKE